jgi:hypothetical protein
MVQFETKAFSTTIDFLFKHKTIKGAFGVKNKKRHCVPLLTEIIILASR